MLFMKDSVSLTNQNFGKNVLPFRPVRESLFQRLVRKNLAKTENEILMEVSAYGVKNFYADFEGKVFYNYFLDDELNVEDSLKIPVSRKFISISPKQLTSPVIVSFIEGGITFAEICEQSYSSSLDTKDIYVAAVKADPFNIVLIDRDLISDKDIILAAYLANKSRLELAELELDVEQNYQYIKSKLEVVRSLRT